MPRIVLTDRFIQAVKAGETGRVDYFDEKTPGLALRVAPGGLKAWTVHFTSPKDGKRARLALGSYPATTLGMARTRALEAKGLAEDGKDPRDILHPRAGAMTVTALVESYIEKHIEPNLRTADSMARRFRKNIVPVIGDVKVAELHRRDVSRCVDPILRRDAPTEAAHCFEDLRAMLRWALSRGDMDRNPIQGMRAPAKAPPRQRALTEDEIRQFWTALPTVLAKSKTCQNILMLCLVTLQRVGEVSGIHRAELDLAKRVWTIPGERSKNGYSHAVPLSDLAVEILETALKTANKQFLFPNKEGNAALPSAVIGRALGRAMEPTEELPQGRFKMAPFTAHDLRRTGVSHMAALGVAPIVLGHVINHRSVTRAGVTLSVYAQYDYAKEKREALELWADRLAAIIEGGAATVTTMTGARNARA